MSAGMPPSIIKMDCHWWWLEMKIEFDDFDLHGMSSSGSSVEIPEGQNEPSNANTLDKSKRKGKRKRGPRGKAAAPADGGTGKRKVSPCWTTFTKPKQDESGRFYSLCIFCGRKYKAEIGNLGTSTLLKHHRTCELDPDSEVNKGQSKLVFKTGDDGKVSGLGNWHFDHNEARNALARMIVIDELPFSFVHGEGFRLFIQTVCPMFTVPCRTTVYKDAMLLYDIEKVKMKTFFKDSSNRICFTIDTWTSVQQINYLCLTVHFIDNHWCLHKRIVNFCPITSHKGEDIGKTLEKCMTEWGIDRVLTITVDNASSNDTALAYLKKKFSGGGSITSVLGARHIHMRCIAHIINLVVEAGVNLLGRSVERIRAAVRYIKLSPNRLQKFKALAMNANVSVKTCLCLDVPTRWNSTYLMLHAALKYETVFELYEHDDPGIVYDLESKVRKDNKPLGMICYDDWVVVKSVMPFLKHFYDLTVRVSGSKYTTSNLILTEIGDTYAVLNKACLSTNTAFSEMALQMKGKYDKYWGDLDTNHPINPFIFICHVFDPRHKMYFVHYVIDNMYPEKKATELKLTVDNTLSDLFDEYLKMFGSSNGSHSTVLSSEVLFNSEPQEDSFSASFDKLISSSQPNDKSELDKYLQEDLETTKTGFNILVWWKNHSARFPVVSRLARDMLVIPISTVSSESAFSTGGRVLNEYRSCLLPSTVEALVCTQDWMRSESNPIALGNYLQAIEALDEDKSTTNDRDLGQLDGNKGDLEGEQYL